jgi:hypothetical protein
MRRGTAKLPANRDERRGTTVAVREAMYRWLPVLVLCAACSNEEPAAAGTGSTGGTSTAGAGGAPTGSATSGEGGTSTDAASSGGTSSGGTSSGGASSGGAASGDRTVGDEWFVMTNAAADYPEFAFDSVFGESDIELGNEVVLTPNATGGPQNRPYVRYTIDNTPKTEFGYGWAKENPYPGLTTGQSLFIRWSHRWIDDYDQTQKFISVVAQERNILVFQPWESTIALRSAQDGGLDCQTAEIPLLDQWIDAQWEIRFGDSGYVKIWYNNNDYASPDAQAFVPTGDPEPSTAYISVAGYHQGNLQDDLPREFDVADVRWGPTFDPSWH